MQKFPKRVLVEKSQICCNTALQPSWIRGGQLWAQAWKPGHEVLFKIYLEPGFNLSFQALSKLNLYFFVKLLKLEPNTNTSQGSRLCLRKLQVCKISPFKIEAKKFWTRSNSTWNWSINSLEYFLQTQQQQCQFQWRHLQQKNFSPEKRINRLVLLF